MKNMNGFRLTTQGHMMSLQRHQFVAKVVLGTSLIAYRNQVGSTKSPKA